MFSLGDFHNLVGQSSEQTSLTGADPASSRRLDLRTSGYSFQTFFFFFFFPWPSGFVGSPSNIVYVFQRLLLSWMADNR